MGWSLQELSAWGKVPRGTIGMASGQKAALGMDAYARIPLHYCVWDVPREGRSGVWEVKKPHNPD